MAAVQSEVRFDKIAEKWLVLARWRLAHISELQRNGRWDRYYTEEQLASSLREAEHATILWATLASQRVTLGKV